MPTTDSNGLVLYTSPDELTPLETAFNVLTASISDAFDSNVRIFTVANVAARNALANQRTPTKENPLLVWRQDIKLFEINDGTGWNGFTAEPNTMVVNGQKYAASGVIVKPTLQMTSVLGAGIYWGVVEKADVPTAPSGYGIQFGAVQSNNIGGCWIVRLEGKLNNPTIYLGTVSSGTKTNVQIPWRFVKL